MKQRGRKAFEVFAGSGHLSKAFRADGWETLEHDLIHGMNVLHPEYEQRCDALLDEADALHRGTECTTMSRANRFPYRDKLNPFGFDSLKGDRLVRCQQGTAMAQMSWRLHCRMIQRGKSSSIENPWTSDLWNLPPFADEVKAALAGTLSPALGVQMYVVKTHYCMWCRSRAQKRTAILTNNRSSLSLNNKCIHKGHKVVLQGKKKFRGIGWASLTKVLGNKYPLAMCSRWVRSVDESLLLDP